jgi:large subunit ribosomal protein L4
MILQMPTINDQDSASMINVSETVFGQKFNETLVHQLVTKYQATARAGTKAQKNRATVSGGGSKPWRQKGTGRARAGTSSSPIWRSGGVTFATRPRSFNQKINKKMYKVGLRSIFSELFRQKRLVVSQDILPATLRTKDLVQKLRNVDNKHILIITDTLNNNLMLASRNIPSVVVLTAESLNPVALIIADKVITTVEALRKIEEIFT